MAKAVPYGLLEIGALLSFAFLFIFDKTWRNSIGALFVKIGNTGFGGIAGHGSVKPLHFLVTANNTVESWIKSGLVASERVMSYALVRAAEPFLLMVGVLLALGLAFAELAKFAVHKAGQAVTRIEHTTVIKKVGAATKVITSVTRAQYNSLVHRVDALGARVAHLAHAIPHGVVALPGRVGITSKQLRRLERRAHALEKKTVGLGAVALVTTALVRMGFKWVKCGSAQRVGRRLNCGSFQFLESLLSLAVEALIITNLCATTKLLTRIGVAAQPMIVKLTTGVADLMRCQGANPLPLLPLASVALPDVEGDGLPL